MYSKNLTGGEGASTLAFGRQRVTPTLVILPAVYFRLPARLGRAGFVNPQGRDERFLCFEALPPFSSFS
jgi:hypothetical protein